MSGRPAVARTGRGVRWMPPAQMRSASSLSSQCSWFQRRKPHCQSLTRERRRPERDAPAEPGGPEPVSPRALPVSTSSVWSPRPLSSFFPEKEVRAACPAPSWPVSDKADRHASVSMAITTVTPGLSPEA